MGEGPIGTRPLFTFGVMLMILSIQLISLGLLAEMIIRNKETDLTNKQIDATIGLEKNQKVWNLQKS